MIDELILKKTLSWSVTVAICLNENDQSFLMAVSYFCARADHIKIHTHC